MAIEITRSPLRIDQIVGDERSQILVESDIIVPENNPDMGRILDITGRISISSKEVIQDKIMVEGVIIYNILYLAEDDDRHIASMEADTSFTNYIDLPDVEPKMSSRIFAEIEHIDWDIINSRKLNMRSVMDLRIEVFELLQLDVVDGISGDRHIEVLSEPIAVSYESGQGEAQTIIRESIELSDNMPTIVEILRTDVKIKELDSKTADNKVIVGGVMDIGFLYLCEDPNYPIHYFSAEIELAHAVDIAGAYQNMDCRCDIDIEDLYLAPKEDLSGDLRLVEVEALLSIEATIIERQHTDVLVDAYMPDGALDIELERMIIPELRGEGQSQTAVKEIIALPENMPKCGTVLYLNAESSITEQQLYEGKVVVDGVVSANILYQPKDSGGELVSFRQDIPFSQEIPIAEIQMNMRCDSHIVVERTSFSLLAPDEIEIKVILNAGAKVFEDTQITAIIDLEEGELPLRQQSGIFVYFIKPGDNIWSIAKRYNTTMENILKFNAIPVDGALEVGSRIVVYKKYDYKRDEMTV